MDEALPLLAGNTATRAPFPHHLVFEAMVAYVGEQLGKHSTGD